MAIGRLPLRAPSLFPLIIAAASLYIRHCSNRELLEFFTVFHSLVSFGVSS